MSILLITTVFTFLAATSLVVMGYLLVSAAQSSPTARIRRRLTSIGQNPYATREQVQSLLKGAVYSDIPWLNALLRQVRPIHKLNMLLERANLDMSVGQFLLLSAFSGALVFLLFGIIKGFGFGLVVGLLAVSGPYVYVKSLSWKRMRAFLEQMPDGLDMVSQGLQAGMGLNQALGYMSKEMPDPVGTEFSVFIEEMNLGLPLNDALVSLQERMTHPEVRLLSTALLVNREVGGSLSELLNKLGDVIRDRFRVERQIKTLTAQNRMSAWVVCSLPPILALFMFWMDPKLMGQMTSEPIGQIMLIAALILEVIGILVFRKLLEIRF